MQEEIAASLGSSRLPVREALRILEAEGLILLKANSGAWGVEDGSRRVRANSTRSGNGSTRWR